MLSYIGSALAFVAGIVVLVKLFQKEGFLKGILGLICMLYTYIWGWMHVKDESLNIKNWMWIWTGAILLGIVLTTIGQVTSDVTSDIIQGLGG
ncbi:MAG: hypothetical protein V2A34_00160 [Lentisphaerota bacterium]